MNLYALVFGESVLNDAVMPLQLSWSLRFNCSWALMLNVQVFGLGFRAEGLSVYSWLASC